jgi:hypothetical protein
MWMCHGNEIANNDTPTHIPARKSPRCILVASAAAPMTAKNPTLRRAKSIGRVYALVGNADAYSGQIERAITVAIIVVTAKASRPAKTGHTVRPAPFSMQISKREDMIKAPQTEKCCAALCACVALRAAHGGGSEHL